ncbi:MAG: hypothetical protein OWT28_05780 [Firmicutes bacterium]|nr:hypothetical protein [Bacillota bacterium]
MRNHDTSLQDQSPLADAGDALRKAQHAVSSLQSHPNHMGLQQAANALAHTEKAISAAQGDENKPAVKELLMTCSETHDAFVEVAEYLSTNSES